MYGKAAPQVRDKAWEGWFGFPAMRMVKGNYPLPDKPGLGFNLTEDALNKYPFARSRPRPGSFTGTVRSQNGRTDAAS